MVDNRTYVSVTNPTVVVTVTVTPFAAFTALIAFGLIGTINRPPDGLGAAMVIVVTGVPGRMLGIVKRAGNALGLLGLFGAGADAIDGDSE